MTRGWEAAGGGARHAHVPADPRAAGDLCRPVRRPVHPRPANAQAFRQYLAGLLLPAERNKTLTALANAEPVVGAQAPAAQRLQWFLSESTWDAAAVTARRLELLRADAETAPARGRGAHHRRDRGPQGRGPDGPRRAAVPGQPGQDRERGRLGGQRVGRRGHLLPRWPSSPTRPERWFARGKADPAFRTKPQIALELVDQAARAGVAVPGGGGRLPVRRAPRLHRAA